MFKFIYRQKESKCGKCQQLVNLSERYIGVHYTVSLKNFKIKCLKGKSLGTIHIQSQDKLGNTDFLHQFGQTI